MTAVSGIVRRLAPLLVLPLLFGPARTAADWVGELMQAFAASEIEFQRSDSNVPFFPVAFLDATTYTDIELTAGGAKIGSFEQWSVSQAAGLPILVSPRDAVVFGEWLSWTRFDSRSEAFESFDVFSAGLPVGWFRQVDDDSQMAAFVMPLAHKASLPSSSWRWEFLGGAFAREAVSDRFWWAYGFFVDVGPGDDYVLPYLGASWELSEKLTLSAVLPWPALLYAPTADTLFRVGAAPSGASWSLSAGRDDLFFELGNWDLGVAAETRIQGDFWFMFEAGVAGLRSLRINGDEFKGPEFDLSSSPFVGIGINFRPSIRD